MLPGNRPIDHRLLHAAEVGKAEAVVEKLMQVGHGCPYRLAMADAQAWERLSPPSSRELIVIRIDLAGKRSITIPQLGWSTAAA